MFNLTDDQKVEMIEKFWKIADISKEKYEKIKFRKEVIDVLIKVNMIEWMKESYKERKEKIWFKKKDEMFDYIQKINKHDYSIVKMRQFKDPITGETFNQLIVWIPDLVTESEDNRIKIKNSLIINNNTNLDSYRYCIKNFEMLDY